jgi:sigma-B regulation protein RsbU (phosphoserine phosphatase)
LIRSKKVRELPGEGVFLGYHESVESYLTEESMELQSGDRLVLYTDGITDASSPQGHRFNIGKLDKILRIAGDMDAGELTQTIFEEVTSYQGSSEQFDDMTLLVVAVDYPDREAGG